ncbi:YTH domain-containing protein ECT4 isoform X1 [Apium graveolens]|uniref:YTH domain-containing protein ECT4 isoform X1 n=1 Tax=Apium graveolens TaxID=4045 RepID=UPI003D791593
MEKTGQPGTDRVASVSTSPVTVERHFAAGNSIEQTLPPKDGKVVQASSANATLVRPPSIVTNPPELLVSSGAFAASYQPNAYAPIDQNFYYGGYDNSNGNWGEYSNYVNANNLQIIPPAMYNDNPSLFFPPSGYSFDTQMTYGQFPPLASPMSPFMLDGQLYSPHQIPMSPNYYPQSISPGLPHVTSSHSMSQTEMLAPVSTGQEGLNDNMLFGPGSGYYLHFGSFPASNPPGNSNLGLYKYPGEFGSGENPAIRSNSDTGNILSPLTPGAVYTQPMGILGPYDLSLAQASQQQTPFTRRYPNNVSSRISNSGNWDTSRFNRLTTDKGGRRDRDSISVSADSHGIPSDRNRGPRALKPKIKSNTEEMAVPGIARAGASTSGVNLDLYNQPDFVTDFERAKFFVIKSFSEDNVHKSIKYQVWASTPLGNRKLDAAYQEAKDANVNYPVFLFFSVNASGQFCGVAEMTGPVDFEKDADYWQQDRWSGQFPVRWHIVKDVPNGQFRHILLDNNENKPVTHSRDSQEVKLEQGLAMLKIFKDYVCETSILDDFSHYDGREERSLQERRAKQPSPEKPDASINQLSENLAGTLHLKVNDEIRK